MDGLTSAEVFLRGLLIGLAIAAPVGPIGLLCMLRTLREGLTAGFVAGLGAASADAVYGTVAALGVTWVADLFTEQQQWLRWGGGTFLLLLGLRIALTQPPEAQAAGEGDGRAGKALWLGYATTFGLTLTNPLTILSFAAIFSGLGLAQGVGDATRGLTLVAGVFLGSAAWWLCLSGTVALAGRVMSPRTRQWIQRASGIVLAAAGVWALAAG